MRWKMFYVDGTTFSNKDGKPEDAPGWGVAAVVQEDETVGVIPFSMKDFYCFAKEFGGWMGLDHYGLCQYLARPGMKIIKVGDNMPTHKYLELIAGLREDPDLPSKSARYDFERSING
ncbi:MAG: hypothetical protein GQ524_11320 [Anaerolineales bacterium]|nr:hypothetical protein [Anaerolineales bacterium]